MHLNDHSITKTKGKTKKGGSAFDRSAFGTYLMSILFCIILLGAGIGGIFRYNRSKTQEVFRAMATENLNAYIQGQKKDTLSKFDDILSTLEALAVLIEQRGDDTFVDTYLMALNENNQDMVFAYTSEKEFKEIFRSGSSREGDLQSLRQLKRGEYVVSDVTFSERRGNIYCVALGVPVMAGGEFSGVIRAIIDARDLVSTSFYPPAQGQIIARFLTREDGTVITVSADNEDDTGNLFDRLESDQVDPQVMQKLRTAMKSGTADSILVGVYDGIPVYLSMVSLGYNDWHLVICLNADMAAAHSKKLLTSTMGGNVVFIILLILVFCILFLFLKRLQRSMTMEEQRYLLLEQFSDTILFDYDCRSDTMRFTDNATKLLKLPNLVWKPFLKEFKDGYVFGEDYETVREVLKGRACDGQNEVRVRLVRASDEKYFWCLIRFRCLYEKGEVVSVIGRISDIDEQKHHEEYLRLKSETDSMTGLLNRQAAEQQINHSLEKNPRGTLFMLDVDDFKEINDTYGHAAGDRALLFLSSCMKKTFRSEDVLGRIGGDEMVIYVSGLLDSRVAEKKIRTLQKLLSEGDMKDMPVLSVSVGTAVCPENGDSFELLFRAADESMYRLKEKKKRAGR